MPSHTLRRRSNAPRQLLEPLEARLLLTVTAVHAGANLQTFINAANPGDTLVLDAGAAFVGNFTLPNKSGNATITIESSALASLPVGVRVGPAQAALMPKLETPGSGVAVLSTAASAHDYQFLGIEFLPQSASAAINDLIDLGSTGTSQNTLAQVPTNLVFDRDYIHGWDGVDEKRGIALNSSFTTITNSYIANFKSTSQDSQAIAGWNGPGNYTITNNYLEGAGENLIFGGADASIPNLVPSNILIRGNYFSKPLSWNPNDPTYAHINYSVKNILELKNASNVTVDKNLFENNWVSGQSGFAIVFTPRNQDGSNNWATVANVTFTNNIVRHSAGGLNYLSSDNLNPSLTAHDITVKNNLFYDIGGAEWGGNGIGFQFVKGGAAATNVAFEHNTLLETKEFLSADSGQSGNVPIVSSGFVFRNNIVEKAQYGAHGTGTGEGTAALTPFFPGYVFTGNAVIGGASSLYPAGNFFPANDAAVGFLDAANADYTLADSSTLKNHATDGTDPGINYPFVVSINRASASPTNAASVNFTVLFTSAVNNVDASDFTLVPTGISGASITSVTGSGTTWNVLVNAGAGNGTLGLNLVDDDSILDANLAPLAGLGPANGNFTGQLYTLDHTPPALAITSPTAGAMLDGTNQTIAGAAGHATGDAASVTLKIYAGTTPTGTPLQTLTASVNPTTGAYSASMTGLPQGQYTVQATQSDNAGNIATSTAITFMTYSTLPGDADGNGTVNFADFVILSNNFGLTSTSGPAKADFNYDGTTNFADFVILSNNFGATAPTAPAEAPAVLIATTPTVVEPAAITPAPQKHRKAKVNSHHGHRRHNGLT